MKIKLAALALAFTALASSLHAQLAVPYANGSDGALVINNSTGIDLSQAVAGVWTNTSGSPGKGIYDSNQWAVVFRYSSVSIATGAALTFSNHPTHAPVVWLVNGNVSINGNVILNGQDGNGDPGRLPEPGPGGFRGGGTYGPGFGPGGGDVFGLPGAYSGTYGNPQIIPLIGGSGGGGNASWGVSGSAGGGAILIAATETITVNGDCHADGGGGNVQYLGSGGAIRLVANQITGNGSLQALGGNGDATAVGRIRLEANTFIGGGITTYPTTPAVTPNNPAIIFPATSAATVTVLNVAGLTAPTDPKASMSLGTGAADLTMATTNAVTIQVQTKNFPTNGTVTVYIKPRNSAQTTLTASFVSGNTNAALWQVSATVLYPAYTVIQARASY